MIYSQEAENDMTDWGECSNDLVTVDDLPSAKPQKVSNINTKH